MFPSLSLSSSLLPEKQTNLPISDRGKNSGVSYAGSSALASSSALDTNAVSPLRSCAASRPPRTRMVDSKTERPHCLSLAGLKVRELTIQSLARSNSLRKPMIQRESRESTSVALRSF